MDLFDCKDVDVKYLRQLKHSTGRAIPHNLSSGRWVGKSHFPAGAVTLSLDKIEPDLPMAFDSRNHHSVWVTPKAMELAGIDENTVCPEEVIEKESVTEVDRNPFREAAQDLVRKIVPDYSVENTWQNFLVSGDYDFLRDLTMSHDAMIDGRRTGLSGTASSGKRK